MGARIIPIEQCVTVTLKNDTILQQSSSLLATYVCSLHSVNLDDYMRKDVDQLLTQYYIDNYDMPCSLIDGLMAFDSTVIRYIPEFTHYTATAVDDGQGFCGNGLAFEGLIENYLTDPYGLIER